MRPVRVIRTGITRTVWLVGPWAVKVPSLRGWGNRGNRLCGLAWSITRGIQANLSEREFSQWEDIRGAVCPPLLCLAGIVSVYPRCEPVTADQFRDDPPPDVPFPDRKRENAGRLHGRTVWIDYDTSWNGCPHALIVYPPTDEEQERGDQIADPA